MYNTHSNSMHSSIPNSQYFIYVFAFLSIFFFSISFSEPPTSEARLICANTTSSDPNFASKFDELMKILSNKFSVQGWASESVKSPSQEIFGLAECYRHLSYADCQLCLTEARNNISRCGSANSGRLYLDGCFIRYDNYSFFTESVDPVHDSVTCDLPTHNLMDKLSQRELMKKVSILTHNVTENAQKSEGFAVGDIKGGLINVYALGQCWKTVNGKECYSCLENASRRVLSCVPSEQGRVMNAGCYLRYSIEKFYDENQHQVGGSSKIGVIVLIILGALAFLMLSLVGAVFAYVKILKKKEGHNQVYQVPDTIQKSNLNFKYEMLEGATNSFDPSMKLGQGGAGSVFKGTLLDGTTVAVKRLFFNTRQWVDEFFNEINSISGIEHKNLVRLLGCSIEGPESLLVYEYVPNKSLDQYLFQKNSTQFLSWQQRRDVILGIADGLAYLHGGAGGEGKIIHRDIKGSNILLDENLTPKIADFGLARSVAGDKTHISTGIAGTLGYMAPEYLVRGQLTDKADVYAFGVLVLEIACGRKSSVFMPGSDSVLQTVWKHYKSKNIVEVVDPRLEGQFSVQEASNVLQVGLLCTQASAALRPSMSEVVMMLNDKENTIPSPKQPPFLNSSVLGSDDSTKTSTMNSLTLNVNTIPDLSSTHKSSTTSDPEPVLSMIETIETR